MNVFKKAYCRLYQTAFRAALPVLPYREPVILKSTAEIARVMKEKQLKSAMLITDGFLKSSGATLPLEAALAQSGIALCVYDQTRSNPTVSNVEEAVAMYVAQRCDCLIAFGGGSAIDCAKAVGARVVYPKRSLDNLKGNLRIFRRLPPLFAVPTTAGTGSEVTVTAVITDEKRKYKYTMNSFPLIPHYAVLDPEVTYTLPKHLTATTGMDALTHAVEAYIGRSTSRETRRLAKEVVQLVFENIETAYNMPENYAARENMLKAAYKAGIAFSKSYVGYVHAVAHSLGGQYNVPHGLANSVLLPLVLEMYGEKIHKKLHELAVYAGVAQVQDDAAVGARKFVDKVKALNRAMGIPETLEGICPADIPVMSKHADREGNPLYPVPVLMDARELEQIYYRIGDINCEQN